MTAKAKKLAEKIIADASAQTGSLSKSDYVELCTDIIDHFEAARDATEQEMREEGGT